MKQLKSALLFGISFVVFSACFNQPEFDDAPKIDFEDIYFVKSTGPGVKDSFVVSLNFKDGDGDLGLSADGEDVEPPYHETDFFINKNLELSPVSGALIKDFTGYTYTNGKKTPQFPSYYVGSEESNGELITLDSRSDGFSIPPYEGPYTCAANLESYLYDTIFVFRDDKHLIKNKATIVDSLHNMRNPSEYYYAVLDYFYINVNPGHYNIKVQYLVKDGDSFTEYDWRKELCTTFDGRFPRLADKDRPLEGTITYAMVSSGFSTTFSIKTMKLAITIYDRALHSSNTFETREFRLDEITK